MKRLNSNVGAAQRSLEQRPEIFHTIYMHAATDISLSLVNYVVNKAPLHPLVISNRIVGINGAAIFYILKNLILQGLACHVRHYAGADLAQIAVKDSLHDGLVLE